MRRCYIFLVIYFLLPFSISSQQYRSEMLNDIMHVQVKENGLVYTDTILIQINERMGDHDAKDRINYQKGEKASFGDIWILNAKGERIRKLNKNEIKERSSIGDFSLYEDKMEKYFETKHHEYPYSVSYTKRQERKKYVNLISFNYSELRIPIDKGILSLEHPVGLQIRQKVRNIDKYDIDTINQTVYHKYYYSHKPKLHREKYASVNTGDAPQIIITPIEFKYGIDGRNDSWETFGGWIYDLNKSRDLLPQSEKEKINLLIGNEESTYEQVKILYRYLQDNTRYINVSTQIGGLQPHPAEYVVQNRYGDCKALTNYMQSMLKYIGVESFYTLIYSDNRVYDLDDDFSYNAFNHAILTVPLQNDTLYLECTSKNSPMGYISTSNQGRKALMIKEKGSKLINIPQMMPEDVLCRRFFDIKILENYDANLNLKVRERGEDYELLNAYNSQASRNRVNHFIRENVLMGSFDITDYEILRNNRDSAYIDLIVNGRMNHVCKKYGNNLVLNPIPLERPQFEEPNKRTQDLQIDYPIYKKDELNILFEGTNISKLPSDINVSSPYGDYYKMSFRKEGDAIIIEKELLITSKRLNIEEYEEFYSFMVKVKNSEVSNFYFEIL